MTSRKNPRTAEPPHPFEVDPMTRWLPAALALASCLPVTAVAQNFPPKMQSFPLYGGGPIPNSKPGADEETTRDGSWITKVSQPFVQVHLPAAAKATGTAVVIFPGGS